MTQINNITGFTVDDPSWAGDGAMRISITENGFDYEFSPKSEILDKPQTFYPLDVVILGVNGAVLDSIRRTVGQARPPNTEGIVEQLKKIKQLKEVISA